MKQPVISIRNYNVNNYQEIINNIKNANFKKVFIEWYDDDLQLQEDIFNYVKEVGLEITFAHLGYQNANALWTDSVDGDIEEKRYINDIKICKKHNINMVVLHPTNEFVNPGLNEIGINRIKNILAEANKNGIKVAFENVELVHYLEYIIKNINDTNLGVCFDAGHSHLFCNDEINMELFKNKILTIHLHDNYQERDDHNLPFDGTIDWDKTIKQIINMGYDGDIVIESGYNDNYKNITIDEYYKLAYERGLRLIRLFEKYDNK